VSVFVHLLQEPLVNLLCCSAVKLFVALTANNHCNHALFANNWIPSVSVTAGICKPSLARFARERHEYAMFEDLRHRYHWVLPTFHYHSTAELLASLQAQIIAPAEQKARELTQPK
jgi:hypothetical protein